MSILCGIGSLTSLDSRRSRIDERRRVGEVCNADTEATSAYGVRGVSKKSWFLSDAQGLSSHGCAAV